MYAFWIEPDQFVTSCVTDRWRVIDIVLLGMVPLGSTTSVFLTTIYRTAHPVFLSQKEIRLIDCHCSNEQVDS